MSAWAEDPVSERILWLNGMAGTGKTTIAYSFCRHLENKGKLAASFFCSRQLPECRDINRIVPSIAYQVSRFSSDFRGALSLVLAEDRDAHDQSVLGQFEHLVAQPMGQMKSPLAPGAVIVMDALDECDAETGVAEILEALRLHSRKLTVKFFITSRPDASILNRMRDLRDRSMNAEIRLHELAQLTVQKDIRTYLAAELGGCPFISQADLDNLAERSGVLFIYASTVVRYISSKNFARAESRIMEVMSTSATSSLESTRTIDALYTAILNAAYEDSELTELDREELLLVLHTVVCTREPLSEDVIAGILGLKSAGPVKAALLPLLSVLHVAEDTRLVTALHESFRDYLSKRSRCGRYYCDAQAHNTRLAKSCFDQICIPSPPFNICNLGSSYLFDSDILDKQIKIKMSIPDELLYACRYWSAHMILTECFDEMAILLLSFLSTRLLLWMEAMNLTGYFAEALVVMHEAEEWLQRQIGTVNEPLSLLLADARKFVSTYGLSQAQSSTPHIYISALSFWPPSSPLGIAYQRKKPSLTCASGTAMQLRRITPSARINVNSPVECLAYSPTGLCIASGNVDGVICIWDTRSGRLIGQPLRGHTNSITTVAYSSDEMHLVSGSTDRTARIWDVRESRLVAQPFTNHAGPIYSAIYSPDGKHIASGSGDKTIRIWSAIDQEPVGQPLVGHTDSIFSIAYAPDGLRIVSGSRDKTIRIWDACSGDLIGLPLSGHDKAVRSVSYSSDGKYIVSGSEDKTLCIWSTTTGSQVGHRICGHTDGIQSTAFSRDGKHIVSSARDRTVRIWDAFTGQPAGPPLTGHGNHVCCVAYSPDGKNIASGSRDKLICIWDALICRPEIQRLTGHAGFVSSVAFSPDSKYIVSGSRDKTLRIWDALTGQPVGRPLTGHTSDVTSIAYSPDGKHIVSGSRDRTICIWDVCTRQLVGRPLIGHTHWVKSVTYSPDGERIVSGSRDQTIRIWNAPTGQQVGPPLTGHTQYVRSVACSPDGKHIASGSEDKTIRIWSLLTGQLMCEPLTGHTGCVYSVAYSPGGDYIVSGSRDNTVRIWDANTGQPVGQPLIGHTNYVHSVSYSPDGKYIVSGSQDMTVRMWHALTGNRLDPPLAGHTDFVFSVAFSPDGKRVASGSIDRTLRVWNSQMCQRNSALLHDQGFVMSQKSHICSSACTMQSIHRTWRLNEHGWIILEDIKKPLLWVPPDLRTQIVYPENTIITSCQYGALYLEFDQDTIGEHWATHFIPIVSSEITHV
ncbi:WD repeat-containing protein [Ceratobasidium sp. AG-Ba]|nr:WD repeat-containing protein [Ceratobasidium sp. AG-Ba]